MMGEMYPKLRSDLEIRAESSNPHSPILIKDPIVKRFYRFSPVQAAVLRLLDGSLSPQEAAETASGVCNTRVETAQVEDFVVKLQGLLLLDTPASWARLETVARKSDAIRSILSIKVKVFNPDALLDRLHRRFRFLFTSSAVGLGMGVIATGMVLSILHREALYVSIASLFSLYSIPLILGVALAVSTVHEFGHALTLKHYGGKVDEMGLLLLYFTPAFYCNTSDAWLLPKRQRHWVTLAGGFVQLVLWGGATIAWRLLATEVWASRVCVVAIAFSGIQTLFNFNPLIRLDGYYLLSDHLEVPNLRPKAFRFMRERLERLLLGAAAQPASPAPPRERRIFWRYGMASLAFSTCLVLIMISRIGGWLVDQFQIWGVLAMSAALMMSVQIASKEAAATGRVLGSALVRARKAPRFFLVLAVIAAGSFLPWELKVSGDFTVRPAERVAVGAQIEGTLRKIRVDENKLIKRGEVLAELENLTLRSDLEETRGQIAEKQASLKLLQAGTRPEEISKAMRQLDTRKEEFETAARNQEERASLRETVKKREIERDNAKEVYQRHAQLHQQGLISMNDLARERLNFEVKMRELSEAEGALSVLSEKTLRNRQVKKKEVEEAQSQVDLLRAGTRREQIDAAAAEVNRLVEKLRNLEQQLAYLEIRSPIDGVVTTPYLANRIGDYVKKGDFFCEVVNLGVVIIDMPVPEKEIADVREGFPIVLKVRGFPALDFLGKVVTIAQVAVESGIERKVLVKSELDNEKGLLKAGMTGVGKILCGKRTIANLSTRRAIRWLRTEFWEYLP